MKTKTILSLALLCIASAAHAESITLTGSGCDASRNCYPVANDAGVPITLYAAPTSAYFYLSVDGVMYVGQGSAGDINQVAFADGGAQAQVVVSFRHWTTKVVSGRLAGRVTQHYEIVSGQVTR